MANERMIQAHKAVKLSARLVMRSATGYLRNREFSLEEALQILLNTALRVSR